MLVHTQTDVYMDMDLISHGSGAYAYILYMVYLQPACIILALQMHCLDHETMEP